MIECLLFKLSSLNQDDKSMGLFRMQKGSELGDEICRQERAAGRAAIGYREGGYFVRKPWGDFSKIQVGDDPEVSCERA